MILPELPNSLLSIDSIHYLDCLKNLLKLLDLEGEDGLRAPGVGRAGP
jgi:hypothetical protein